MREGSLKSMFSIKYTQHSKDRNREKNGNSIYLNLDKLRKMENKYNMEK